MEFTQLEISPHSESTRWGIDMPQPGTPEDGYDFTVIGWVVDRSRRPTQVEVLDGDEVIGWGAVQWERPDILAAFPDHPHAEFSGFRLSAGTVGLPTTFECRIDAVFEDGSRHELARLAGRRRPLRTDFNPMLQPLLVTSLGRSGSTWMVALLAQHPAIVAHRAFPYETRMCSYWMHALKVLARPANHDRSGGPDSFAYDKHFVGHNPFNFLTPEEAPAIRDWWGRGFVEGLAAFAQRSVDSFYRLQAEANRQVGADFFVEKRYPSAMADLASEMYPQSREIFLVRDFRDMLCSILAFNAKRGYAAFGRELVETEEAYVGELAVSATMLHTQWRRRAHRALLVRYEDLLTDPRSILRGVFDYLGVDSSLDGIEATLRAAAAVPGLAGHMTSADQRTSIGRWRRDMAPELHEVCLAKIGSALQSFGYETGPRPVDQPAAAPAAGHAAEQ